MISVGFLLLLAFIAWWMIEKKIDALGDTRPSQGLEVIDQSDRKNVEDQPSITADRCLAAGGTWNSCGSACRGKETDVCIELCVEYCECNSSAQCPVGRSCGDVIDGVGICK